MLKISWLVLLATLLFTTNSAMAKMQYWTVAKVQGEAILTKPGFAPRRVELHDNFGAGQKISTSAGGTVSLIRNSEAFIVLPNSEIEIPSAENTSTFTLFFQTLGTVLFSAQKKNNQHFKVQTPFAVALVKGTTFFINVTRDDYQIQVFEGSVELKGHNRADSHLVNAGNQSQVTYRVWDKIKIKKVLSDLGNNPHLGNDIEKLANTYRDRIVIGARGKSNLQKIDQQLNGKISTKVNQKAIKNLKLSSSSNANSVGKANANAANDQQSGNANSGNSSGNSNSGGNGGGNKNKNK